MIDTHTHISDPAFAGEEEDVILRARQAGVEMMLLPDVDSTERGAMLALADRHPDVLRPMVGLYPGSVGADWEAEFDLVERQAAERSFVAVGEIGLDYHEGKEFAAQQKDALAAQLELAARLDLPVNIHLRDAMGDFLDVLRAHRHLGIRGDMHAFSGSYESFLELQRIGDWRIGVGGVVTFKNAATLSDVVRRVPLERIVLETDAPYLTPVPYRGKRNESAYLPLVVRKIAELRGIAPEEVDRVTTASAHALFNI